MATDDVTFFSEDHGFGLVSRDVDDHISICFFSVNALGYRALPDDEGSEFTFRRRGDGTYHPSNR
jgi:cold shock CspA family protein